MGTFLPFDEDPAVSAFPLTEASSLSKLSAQKGATKMPPLPNS